MKKEWLLLGMMVWMIGQTERSESFTPYEPQEGWTYYIEAVREQAWPACAYRFLSYPSSCDSVDLWNGAGINQQWTLRPVPGSGASTFYLQTSCGAYLSYPGDCSQHLVDTWPQAGVNQQFTFVPGGRAFEYYLVAQGRASCDFRYLSFPVPCSTSGPDLVDLWDAAGPDQSFLIFPVAAAVPVPLSINANGPCADPFAWYSDDDGQYHLVCTGGDLNLFQSSFLSTSTIFQLVGNALSGSPPSWASSSDRWAPENTQSISFSSTSSSTSSSSSSSSSTSPSSLKEKIEIVEEKDNTVNGGNIIFVADGQLNSDGSEGAHRIGWVWSRSGVQAGNWSVYSPTYLTLSPGAAGDIDPHVFTDPRTQQTYLVWKSDDNRIGSPVTNIWAQEILITASNGSSSSVTVKQLTSPQIILNSTGLWWADSFVAGGSLIEGPEVVYYQGYYYLFFAAGRYCTDSYAEGVARSSSFWGPYEKLGVPLLSTGMVGAVNGVKLVGPGHASFLYNHQSNPPQWYAVYHASVGENCVRYPFIVNLLFDSANQWPYANWV